MGRHLIKVKFKKDDTILYGWYHSVCDEPNESLCKNIYEWYDLPVCENICYCGNDEPVEIATIYAGGFWWNGMACRKHMNITTEYDVFEETCGLPEWWSNDGHGE